MAPDTVGRLADTAGCAISAMFAQIFDSAALPFLDVSSNLMNSFIF
ncbi:hypothetical protein HT136_08765 [Novosphingobium profundi]|nr:hypothetical protein [Novosphingobium profundi]